MSHCYSRIFVIVISCFFLPSCVDTSDDESNPDSLVDMVSMENNADSAVVDEQLTAEDLAANGVTPFRYSADEYEISRSARYELISDNRSIDSGRSAGSTSKFDAFTK